jgi:sporulation protein YlmC with PRC-barrel domain
MFKRMTANARKSVRADSRTDACLLKTTSLIKDDVYDAAGAYRGRIEDIVIDTRSGCIRYAVLALGGFLGIGRKRIAVPWSALTPDAHHQRCIVDVTLMRLMAVPVSQGDPSPRRAGLSWSTEGAHMLRQQGFLGLIRDERPG